MFTKVKRNKNAEHELFCVSYIDNGYACIFTKRGYLVGQVAIPQPIIKDFEALLSRLHSKECKQYIETEQFDRISSWREKTLTEMHQSFWEQWYNKSGVCEGDVPIKIFGIWTPAHPIEAVITRMLLILTFSSAVAFICMPDLMQNSLFIMHIEALKLLTGILLTERGIKILMKNSFFGDLFS